MVVPKFVADGTVYLRKLFEDGEHYNGTIESFDEEEGWYFVKYDDGDVEDITEIECTALVNDYNQNKNDSVVITSSNDDNDDDEDDDDDDDEEEIVTTNTTSTTGRRPTSRRRSSQKKAMSYAEDSSSEEEEEEVVTKKKKKTTNHKKQKKTVTKKKKAASSAGRNKRKNDDDESDFTKSKSGGGQGVSMADAFQPTNNPVFWKYTKKDIDAHYSFLDPCGMEATDDIIGGLVGRQVDKVGLLLQRALSSSSSSKGKKGKGGTGTAALGSVHNPLKLGTACSGTDAPSLALGMVHEYLSKRGLPDLFHYEHQYSCEVEPFKQSYIARNFDGILYPDIAKLTEEHVSDDYPDELPGPRDVYGRIVPLPDINYFVAGTSCKNFSMLMSKFRLDIEDKGCSGETFMGAVEVLLKTNPKICIFENVIGAPWKKMAEYITGRIKISEMSTKKGKSVGTSSKKGGGGDLELERDTNTNKIQVTKVPNNVGVRCGSIVKGFMKGNDDNTVYPVKWPKKKSGSSSNNNRKQNNCCTLKELLQSNNIDSNYNDSDVILCFETPVTYCCRDVKVDSKDYGVPQTRQRTYMLVWQPDDKNDINDDLGDYFEIIVRHLEYKVKHSLEAFVLEDDHDVIRVFREALRGPPGRETKRQEFQAGDFWTSASANLKHNKICRARSGIDEGARYITNWKPHGGKHVPPHYWLEYLNMQQQRSLDMMDVLHASAARDAEAHDSNHSSFTWNISQNVSKEKHRSAMPGTASCITPGGDLFLPHMGRPVLGSEKLLLQGIPYFSLALGNETEVQLSDLAGNAMTLSVVCSTLLAAMTCRQLRTDGDTIAEVLENALLSSTSEEERTQLLQKEDEVSIDDATEISEILLDDLAKLSEKAFKTSIWCTCETSGQNSISTQFLSCRISRIRCCRECCNSHAGYQLDSLDVEEITIQSPKERDPSVFENELRNVLPPTIVFKEDETMMEKDGDGILFPSGGNIGEDAPCKKLPHFALHRIRRQRRSWLVIYYARDSIDQPIAEFKLRIGEISTQRSSEVELGVQGEFKSFLPARMKPYRYGPLDPIAKISVRVSNKNEEENKVWQVVQTNDDEVASISMDVIGSQPGPSYRIIVGLNDLAESTITNHMKNTNQKVLKELMNSSNRGEKRRCLYPKSWKEWPSEITIGKVDSKNDQEKKQKSLIEGKYVRVGCKHAFNQDALWIRESTGSKPAMYLMLKPCVSRTGPDVATVSTSLSYLDTTCVVAIFPLDWQPCDALDPNLQRVKGIQFPKWSPAPSIRCLIPPSNISVTAGSAASNTLLKVNGLNQSDIEMLTRGATAILPKNNENNGGSNNIPILQLSNSQKAQQSLRGFNSICVAPILKFTASCNLSKELSPTAEWKVLYPKDGIPFGTCLRTIPKKAAEKWYFDQERKIWDRRGESGASRQYYLDLQNAPQVFDFKLDSKKGVLSIGVNPEVAAHSPARCIIEDRGPGIQEDLVLQYRLSSLQSQADPKSDRFKVFSCDNEDPTDIQLRSPHRLYARQQKVVTKMLKIEQRNTDFEEIEMSQHVMPGSMGWSVVSKASRPSKLSGGVICDAIGAGKTVVSIALILNGLKDARTHRCSPNKSSASLVAVPPGLIQQWGNEIKKFSKGLKVICIYDFNELKKISVKDILGADVLICPVDILESKGYLDNLMSLSKVNNADVPKLPSHDGKIEKSGAKGVWITAGSNNPYGSGNTPKSQSYRNASARYSYVYQNAINSIREKTFSDNKKGVPLEYFEWERIFVDEVHECLVQAQKIDKKKAVEDGTGFFQEKNRRASRELLGLMTKDIRLRPLLFRKAIFGLTGTPLLDNSNRVIELANLMGNTYVLGLSSHWRKLEKESSRDIFLHTYLEPKTSREIRGAMYFKCQQYLDIGCCRNKTDEQMVGIKIVQQTRQLRMDAEEAQLYLKSQHGIPSDLQSFDITPEDFDPTAGHDISKFLRQNSNSKSRGAELVKTCRKILNKDPTTKIIVFADGAIGGGIAAKDFLTKEADLGCTWLEQDDSVMEKNRKISWYQYADITEEDKKRPRILVLHFEHAAGLNLQMECYNLILFSPLYIGSGGVTGNAVSDTSTELQTIGRVYRPGQPKEKVNVFRIEMLGPDGEECLDGKLIRRNTDQETVEMAINSAD
ncbi:hypothetical protein FRACYDRAFT_212855 [Fragilariopsis cylindrus CCMP1102]|uniref:Helicase ATP-binding domain-containing protein n=1 Tax=Fragilariopsis cylindrus CCMP1102 TaxID=635003 RepID=A0A1E7EQW5_9STRA|nr:hypothetical protein FRACYDRAFT_212855 [Fragilariopsis cylindrus CCMP1102]|eukprot:OEU08217.1 hypothetical protein FRACYDRAFT_212855 [Fragilariopsis cylindrus CCMP1102]